MHFVLSAPDIGLRWEMQRDLSCSFADGLRIYGIQNIEQANILLTIFLYQ